MHSHTHTWHKPCLHCRSLLLTFSLTHCQVARPSTCKQHRTTTQNSKAEGEISACIPCTPLCCSQDPYNGKRNEDGGGGGGRGRRKGGTDGCRSASVTTACPSAGLTPHTVYTDVYSNLATPMYTDVYSNLATPVHTDMYSNLATPMTLTCTVTWPLQ